MSDPIADAATQLAAENNEQVTATSEGAGSAAVGESQQSSPASTTSITPAPSSAELPSADASTSPAGAATPAITGNFLVNETPTVDAPNVVPAADAGAPEAGAVPVAGGDVLPRESHLMLLDAKIAGFRAKLANAERVALDEFEAIVGHIKAVL